MAAKTKFQIIELAIFFKTKLNITPKAARSGGLGTCPQDRDFCFKLEVN